MKSISIATLTGFLFAAFFVVFSFGCGKTGNNPISQNAPFLAFLAQAGGGGTGGGSSYTAYGTTTCAAGWSVAYAGVAHVTEVIYSTVTAYAGGGALFCAPAALPVYSDNATSGRTVVMKLSSGATDLTCVLCVK